MIAQYIALMYGTRVLLLTSHATKATAGTVCNMWSNNPNRGFEKNYAVGLKLFDEVAIQALCHCCPVAHQEPNAVRAEEWLPLLLACCNTQSQQCKGPIRVGIHLPSHHGRQALKVLETRERKQKQHAKRDIVSVTWEKLEGHAESNCHLGHRATGALLKPKK
eukprot:CAMPEP_0203909482 /NCGR_PEP_ID=MMETSP0359-20131031/50782_1 /ASSEMBLY_ACC=CAM_ASM_000338 /TAXON_ID=268821 /ORGANISM="Scrippsiella Hangoei, Strain SHTV-5" /LENGTH=162 /DNA_ID=CAMNT_0050834733 /DNA_START=398 /DNA_END=886 /DNA_ORIENTATION=+